MFGRSRTMERLDRMLEDAINGCFTESRYDETELSRLENRFRQYLEMRELQAEAARQEREALRELVTDLSHQMKTPLAALTLYAQILEEQCRRESVGVYEAQSAGWSTERYSGERDSEHAWLSDSQDVSQSIDRCGEKSTCEHARLSDIQSGAQGTDRCGGKNACEHAGPVESHYISAEAVHCAGQIRLQAEKLESLIGALVQLSRLETGMVEVVPRPLPIKELVGGSVRLLEAKAAAKGIFIQTGWDEKTQSAGERENRAWQGSVQENRVRYGSVQENWAWHGNVQENRAWYGSGQENRAWHGNEQENQAWHGSGQESRACYGSGQELLAMYDARWTQEALVNVLDNAVKYSPAGSTVTVTVRALELFACICVEDEGMGVPEEERAKIFGRFYRGANAVQEEGCGVGLYLTRMILQKEGGYVRVQPRREGGCSFQIYLPRK